MTEEKERKLNKDEDWIDYPKYKNSIKKLLQNKKYMNGVPDNSVIAKALMMTEKEVEETYKSAIAKLRHQLVQDEN